MQVDWPDPRTAADAAQFVAALRQVRARAGLSFRQLERRAEQAGDLLPTSTLNAALSRDRLPRPELVAAFVRACGGDESTVRDWLAVRADLAAGVAEPAGDDEPEDDRSRWGSWRRRWPALAAGAVVAVLVGMTTAIVVVGADDEEPVESTETRVPVVARSSSAPGQNRTELVLAHSGLCVGEGPELFQDSGRIVLGQHDCATAGPPVRLEPLPQGRYRLLLHHPENGTGCVTVDYGGETAKSLLAGAECEPGRPDQEFTFEPVTSPVPGHRLRSVAGARWCVGVYEASQEPGVQLIQDRCTGGEHEVFVVEGLPK